AIQTAADEGNVRQSPERAKLADGVDQHDCGLRIAVCGLRKRAATDERFAESAQKRGHFIKALALARNQNKPQARKIRLEPVIDVESDFLLRSLSTAGDPHQVLTFNGKEPSQFPRARILSTRLNAIEFYRSGDLNMIRPERPVIRRVLLRLCRNQ